MKSKTSAESVKGKGCFYSPVNRKKYPEGYLFYI